MPTSSAGNSPAGSAGVQSRGVTLIELIVVLAIIGLLVAITLPGTTNGLSSVRLKGAAGDVATFMNSALNRAERHEQVMEIIVYPKENKLVLDSSEPGYTRTLNMPSGISIAGDNPLRILLMPGSAPPRAAIDLYNERGNHRIVKLDSVTGVPEVVVPQ
jgi:prepilin-type N-terminal cleavage/methylation domain-containing protein